MTKQQQPDAWFVCHRRHDGRQDLYYWQYQTAKTTLASGVEHYRTRRRTIEAIRTVETIMKGSSTPARIVDEEDD